MRRFQFTLDSMLHYKDALLDKEKNTLMQIKVRLIEAEERIERTQNQILEMDAEMKQKAQRGTTAMELKLFEFHQDNSRNLLKQLEIERSAIAAEEEQQRRVVVALSQEVSGLDKLKEKQYEEYQYDIQKEEELRIGELVSSKYIAAQKPD